MNITELYLVKVVKLKEDGVEEVLFECEKEDLKLKECDTKSKKVKRMLEYAEAVLDAEEER